MVPTEQMCVRLAIAFRNVGQIDYVYQRLEPLPDEFACVVFSTEANRLAFMRLLDAEMI